MYQSAGCTILYCTLWWKSILPENRGEAVERQACKQAEVAAKLCEEGEGGVGLVLLHDSQPRVELDRRQTLAPAELGTWGNF